jgi:putative addiction module CopG family antidote
MKVALTPHQEKFIARKMKSGGYASPDEIVREALRVYEVAERDLYDPELEAALRHSLSSPAKKYQKNHFTRLAGRRPSSTSS